MTEVAEKKLTAKLKLHDYIVSGTADGKLFRLVFTATTETQAIFMTGETLRISYSEIVITQVERARWVTQ
jgi:hypothetical protein